MTFILFVAIIVSVLGVRKFLDREQFANFSFTAGLNSNQIAILNKHFKFYQALPEKSKKIFEFRIAKFIKMKKFIPRNMSEVTEEMKVLIAASAIQLTFGFPRVFLMYFKYIIVFPEAFFSSTNKRFHKGEVNPKAKAIVLSWKHFVEGYAREEGVNLGLHEMAHALQLENIVQNHEYAFLNENASKQWQSLARSEINKIRGGQESFFRQYGATDHAEFFAIAVENFFENPQGFSSYSYEMYRALCKVLNQDPLLLYENNN